MCRSIRNSTLLVCLALAAPFVAAQGVATPDSATHPDFEAVSIRPVDAKTAQQIDRGYVSPFPTNLLVGRSIPISFLIQWAYNVELQDYILSAPPWMETQLYDISAKVDGDQKLTIEQMRPMLQSLLAKRFHFAAHMETRMHSGFALVPAKGGPKLHPSPGEGKPSAQMLRNRIDAGHMDVAHFASILAHNAGQPVVDKSGITGNFDFTLSFAPANDPSSNLPDFFTALQEQLGLKLEPQKVPIEYLVIDHIDRTPTDN